MNCIKHTKLLASKSVYSHHSSKMLNNLHFQTKVGGYIQKLLLNKFEGVPQLQDFNLTNYQQYFIQKYGIPMWVVNDDEYFASMFVRTTVSDIKINGFDYKNITCLPDEDKFIAFFSNTSPRLSQTESEMAMKCLRLMDELLSKLKSKKVDISRITTMNIINVNGLIDENGNHNHGHHYSYMGMNEYSFRLNADDDTIQYLYVHEFLHNLTLVGEYKDYLRFPYRFNRSFIDYATKYGRQFGYYHIELDDEQEIKKSIENNENRFIQTSTDGWFFDLKSEYNTIKTKPFTEKDIQTQMMLFENPDEFVVYGAAESIMMKMKFKEEEEEEEIHIKQSQAFEGIYNRLIDFISVDENSPLKVFGEH